MYRKLTFVFVFCGAIAALGVTASGQYYSNVDTISVISVEAFPGDTVTVPIDLLNTFAVGGFQVRVVFDSWYLSPVAMRLSSRSQIFDLFGAYFDEPGAATFLAASQHPIDNYMPSGSGTVVTLDLALAGMAPPGSYLIRFENRDSVSHQNALSNTMGDSLVVPVLVPRSVEVPSQAIGDEGRLPEDAALSQNYPNPFNGSTGISFSLDEPGQVELIVFDLLGRHVATLFSGSAPAGPTTVFWDGTAESGDAVCSGFYGYRLISSGGIVVTKKMTLLK